MTKSCLKSAKVEIKKLYKKTRKEKQSENHDGNVFTTTRISMTYKETPRK